MILGTKSDD